MAEQRSSLRAISSLSLGYSSYRPSCTARLRCISRCQGLNCNLRSSFSHKAAHAYDMALQPSQGIGGEHHMLISILRVHI